MNTEQSAEPTLVYRFFQGIGILGFIPFVIFTVDMLLTPSYPHPIYNSVAVRLAQGLLIAPLTVALGYLCVRRARGNIIGWLLIILGYGISVDGLRGDFGSHLFRAALGYVLVTYFWFTNILLPCYFPDGHLFPPRFERWGNRVVAIFCLIFGFVTFSTPEFYLTLNNALVTGRYSAPNPFYIPAFAIFSSLPGPIILVVAFYGMGSLIFRYRAADHYGRLQLRWLLSTYIFTFMIGSLPIPAVGLATTIIFGFLFPLTITFAILRHRLYDIDIIIRRTLIYSVLTTILAIIYFGGVILTQQLFKVITGETSDLAIVISTLLIAALFSPIRRRVQAVIDRRLYRRKYDVEQTLAAYNQTLRDEVDVETLKSNLIGVVDHTMQPTKIALWIKTESASLSIKSAP